MTRTTEWRKLPITLTELTLATTLRCGQSFRWKQQEDQSWTCTLRGRIVQLAQDNTHLRYRSIWPSPRAAKAPLTPPASTAGTPKHENVEVPDDAEGDTLGLITHYLNLAPVLAELYETWSAADANFKKKAPRFAGVRILRQDAWEALIGFICSSNNNIIRISQMVEKLCVHYGPYVATWDGRRYHDFPAPERLTGDGVEGHLRELGFGYRAKYISKTARMVVQERGEGWLDGLRNPESPVFGGEAAPAGEMKPEGRDGYREAHEQLLALQGVGPKVADCVCLMGLGWGEAVPVDTHFWQIAQRDYKFGKGKHSSLTKVTYDAVANHFRKLWGKEAGWAHSVLFAADLRVFSERLSTKVEVKEETVDAKDGTMVVKTEVKEVVVKREFDTIDVQPKVEIDEVTMTMSDRVKRRRRG